MEFDNSKQKKYLKWYCERGFKTRTGKENEQKRSFNPVLYATGGKRCPILYYKEFRKHHPTDMLKEDSQFFLATKNRHDDLVWYLSRPLGKNKIGEFPSNAAKECGLKGQKVANHSVRKTSIGYLMQKFQKLL